MKNAMIIIISIQIVYPFEYEIMSITIDINRFIGQILYNFND